MCQPDNPAKNKRILLDKRFREMMQSYDSGVTHTNSVPNILIYQQETNLYSTITRTCSHITKHRNYTTPKYYLLLFSFLFKQLSVLELLQVGLGPQNKRLS